MTEQPDIYEKYKDLSKQFLEIGLEAQVTHCNCKVCYHLRMMFFREMKAHLESDKNGESV